MSTIRREHVEVDGIRIHHLVAGRGEPVVLVHGLASSGHLEWRWNLGPLSAGHRVLAPDLPGCGRSEMARSYGIEYLARILDGYINACGLDRPVVVGISMGGRVAIELALTSPRSLGRLVLVNTLGLGWPLRQPFYPLVMLPGVGEAIMQVARLAIASLPPRALRRLAASHASPGTDPATWADDEYLEDLRRHFGRPGFAEAYLATVRSLGRPSVVAGNHVIPGLVGSGLPILLLWGRDDPLFPVAHAERAHRLLPGSRLEVIDRAGHNLPAERPAEFNAALAAFLDA